MIKCCYCGINILIVGSKNMGWLECVDCGGKQWAIPKIGRSFKESQVEIDHEKETINIKDDN